MKKFYFCRRPNPAPGDNVESVDMEMSDEESENKKGNRGNLVDVRAQDRDMRVPNMPPLPPPGPQHHHSTDMDMRMMPGPGGSMNAMVSIHLLKIL